MRSTSTGSNTNAIVEDILTKIGRALQRAADNGLDSLKAYRDAGLGLIQLKKILPHGQFGREVELRFGYGKQWRARLMALARTWLELEQAFEWAKSMGQPLGRSEFSVDGARALITRWKCATAGYAEPNSSRQAKEKTDSTQSEIAALRKRLRSALADLAQAHAENRALRAELDRQITRQPIDDRTLNLALKVAALWARGGTPGERRAAEDRLRAIATRLGWPFEAFLAECGIESPADWTQACAA